MLVVAVFTHLSPPPIGNISRLSHLSPPHIRHGTLHPQLGIQLVGLQHPPGHGPLGHCLPLDLLITDKEDALEPKFGETPFQVRGCRHLEQPVAGPRPVRVVQRRVAAADQDRVGRLGQHDEVVGDFGARLVR